MADPHEDDGESADGSPQAAAASDSHADATAGDPLRERVDTDSGAARQATSNDADSPSGADSPDRSVVAEVDDPDIEAVLGERRTLHGRVRVLWILRRIVPALMLGAIAGVAVFSLELVGTTTLAVGVGGAVAAVVFLVGVVHALALYRSWHYVVRDNSLYLNRGVFTVVQTVVPYVRVQHIDTRRSAFERALGLSSLVVYTAGSRGADVTIPGLTPDRAETLQSRLKRLAIESEDEDAV